MLIASYGGLKSQELGKSVNFWLFWKNDPLRGNLQNSVPKGFTTSPIHVLCVNFVKFGRPEIGKVVRYLPDKKKQKFASLSRSRFCAVCGQSLPGPTSDKTVLHIHPNQFTFGGVIAERVNTVQTHRKVFPILDRSLASSRIYIKCSCRWYNPPEILCDRKKFSEAFNWDNVSAFTRGRHLHHIASADSAQY